MADKNPSRASRLFSRLDLQQQLNDLGFGSRVSQEVGLRLLNRDGTFNVERGGFSYWESFRLYHALLTMSWIRFLLTLWIGFLSINAFFGLLFLRIGPDSLAGSTAFGFWDRWLEAFFFSVQTVTTVGYGHISPQGWQANIVATVASFSGLLGFAMATGMLFARFSRPTARIRFSRRAVMAPYRGLTGFEFRIINERQNLLIEVEAKVIYSKLEHVEGRPLRRFYQLHLERNKVAFFPLQWTIVHPIDETSPLFGCSRESMEAQSAEFLILITAIDDTFSQVVHSRSSYRHDEVEWGARFQDMFRYSKDQVLGVDAQLIDATAPANEGKRVKGSEESNSKAGEGS